MRAAGKKLLQTFERTNGGVNGYAVGLKHRCAVLDEVKGD